MEKYDDVLTAPYDVAVANGGPTEVLAAATESGAGDIVTGTAVRDASQITGHIYTVVLSGAAGTLTVTDATTGQVLINAAANADIPPGAAAFIAIPGVALTLDPAAAANFSSTITTTKAVTDRYLFVADTGNDRIKVVAASDNAVTATNDWLPGEAHTMIAQPAGSDVGLVANQDYFYTVASTVEDYAIYTLTFPIKEGTLSTITADPAGAPVTWTRVDDLVTAGPSDNVYTVDWTNGKITFGDGVHGAIPTATTVLSFTYTTTPDVMRYGTSGSGPGRFSAPRGVAARWNSLLGAYDVYVADTGNNRIQKLAFYPASPALNLPARMEFVCEWNTASSASDYLNNPVDIAVALDNQTLGTDRTCYVAVSDQGNNRILTYVDDAATTGGGSIVPTWDASVGARGNGLGLYTQVEGICLLNNGNDLDIYACDGQRGIVAKYEESVATTITGIMGTSLPDCFPQSSSYTFTITSTNPPIGGHIEFWYSTEDTFDEATAHLCFPADSILATAATAVWSFVGHSGRRAG